MWAAEFLAFARSIHPAARLRLAPTPSGYLHAGNALNFILNWLAARSQPDAKLFLRIDDLDADRKRPAYVTDIFESLHWLGLDWDEGPVNAWEFETNWSQTLRNAQYDKALEALRSTGLVYACAKSRQDLAPFNGLYPLEFREQQLALDAPNVAWRIMTPPDFSLPDFVVRRRDGVPAYQIASLVDDLSFGISHVVRGADLISSTIAQQWLAEQLGWTDFSNIQFLHHPLLTDETGQKLSKSAGAAALLTQRTQEHPGWVFSSVADLLQLPPVGTATELLCALEVWLAKK